MTTWHFILIAGCGLAVLVIMAVRWLEPFTTDDTADIEGAPEAESDRRFTTKVQKGRDNFIL